MKRSFPKSYEKYLACIPVLLLLASVIACFTDQEMGDLPEGTPQTFDLIDEVDKAWYFDVTPGAIYTIIVDSQYGGTHIGIVDSKGTILASESFYRSRVARVLFSTQNPGKVRISVGTTATPENGRLDGYTIKIRKLRG
jgi:hypothetical protein